jgi:hypothetical protein
MTHIGKVIGAICADPRSVPTRGTTPIDGAALTITYTAVCTYEFDMDAEESKADARFITDLNSNATRILHAFII